MADSNIMGNVRGSKGRNERGLGDHSKATSTRIKTPVHTSTYGHADKVESRRKGKHKIKDKDLKEIPVIDSKKYSHHCLQCEGSFVSKSQLEKHNQCKHEERTQATEMDGKVPKTVGRGRGRKRVTENAETSPKKCKKQKKELNRHSENGECTTQNSDNNLTNATKAQEALTSNELSKNKKQIPFPEEDPERTKHRRKQKTPKKFTGEQPSISGTFGLKGLSKQDDKGRGRGKKKTKTSCTEELQRKPLGVHIKKEPVTYLPGSQEEKWHQEITEKGEVICPNCVTVHRKTVAGLKKHLEICKELQDALKCQHCKKQFKSKAGLKYHMMAEHNNKPVMNAEKLLDDQQERERLRCVLKQMGKLKCPNEGCTTTFTSLMGYQYHLKRCGKEPEDIEKAVFICEHCEKEYKSKAGHDHHVKSEHTMAPEDSDQKSVDEDLENSFEKTPSGRIRRRSAQVAVFHLQEIAEDELSKLWTRKRNKDDLVPDIKRLKYTRPGFPTFNPTQLERWKNEVKENGQICCPNNGEHLVGKYRCLICQKEFSSESGVKYHINNSHSENWFRASAETPQRSKKELKVTNSERKQSTIGKKRGRKRKEKASELSRKDKEMAGTKTADQITTQYSPGLKSNSKVKRRNILSSSKKGTTNKMQGVAK